MHRPLPLFTALLLGQLLPSPAHATNLLLNLSIHVEGRDYCGGGETVCPNRAPDETAFLDHLADLQSFADSFHAAGARLNFEVTERFIEGIVLHAPTTFTDWQADGHNVDVHADLGAHVGDYSNTLSFAADLGTLRSLAVSAGANATGVSGVCSDQDWVTASSAAGFDYITGIVRYCYRSQPVANIPATADMSQCTHNIGNCHENWTENPAIAAAPLRASDGDDWHNHEPGGPTVILGSWSGHNLICLSELYDSDPDNDRSCVEDSLDIVVLADLVREQGMAGHPTSVPHLSLSWSIGSVPNSNFVTELLATVATLDNAAFSVTWATLDQIAALVP